MPEGPLIGRGPVSVGQAEEQGNTPAKQMMRIAWRAAMPLLITLTLDLKVRL